MLLRCLWRSHVRICVATLTGPLCALAQPRLELDPEYSPPATIPSDPRELIYSAPAMDHMLEPVKVRVLDDNDNWITEPVKVIATTVLASGLPGDVYDGIICTHNKWTHRAGRCRYMDNNCEELSCNSTDPSYPFGKVEVISENGVATFPRLLHTRPSTNGQRRLEFSAEINGTTVNITTHPFNVDCKLTSTLYYSCNWGYDSCSFFVCVCFSLLQCKQPGWTLLLHRRATQEM